MLCTGQPYVAQKVFVLLMRELDILHFSYGRWVCQDMHSTSHLTTILLSLASWIAWQPLINARQEPDSSSSSRRAISLIAKLLFGFFLCAAVLLGEKFSIQFIAGKFHERSYAGQGKQLLET